MLTKEEEEEEEYDMVMHVLVPMSQGGERTCEPYYTSNDWNSLSVEKREEALKDIKNPEKDFRFKFTRDEAIRLKQEGMFNGPAIGGFERNLRDVMTQTVIDSDGDTMIKLLARFDQQKHPTLPDDTLVGTIFPRQLTQSLFRILTGPGPVNQ